MPVCEIALVIVVGAAYACCVGESASLPPIVNATLERARNELCRGKAAKALNTLSLAEAQGGENALALTAALEIAREVKGIPMMPRLREDTDLLIRRLESELKRLGHAPASATPRVRMDAQAADNSSLHRIWAVWTIVVAVLFVLSELMVAAPISGDPEIAGAGMVVVFVAFVVIWAAGVGIGWLVVSLSGWWAKHEEKRKLRDAA